VVSTTGMISRELFECREQMKQSHGSDFMTVGSMGHSSQIALAVASLKTDRKVYCLDGDGALIMHMGSLAIIGSRGPANFKHVLLNNGAHDSVGGQPTAGFSIDIQSIVKACGYKVSYMAETSEEIIEKMNMLQTSSGPAFLEVRVKKGARKDLGRPTSSPIQNKRAFMDVLNR